MRGNTERGDGHGRFLRGRLGNPAGRPKGCRDHVNRPTPLLLAGEGEALTCEAIELALDDDPAAMRLCLERILGPMPRARGRVRDAADP
jgi:Family of unknown function (DUF5681)